MNEGQSMEQTVSSADRVPAGNPAGASALSAMLRPLMTGTDAAEPLERDNPLALSHAQHEIDRLTHEIAVLAGLHARQQHRLDELDAELHTQRALAGERAARVAILQEAKDQLNRALARKAAEVAGLDERLKSQAASFEATVAGLKARVEKLRRDERRLTQALERQETLGRQRKEKLKALYASTSWRVTRPLRWVSDILRP